MLSPNEDEEEDDIKTTVELGKQHNNNDTKVFFAVMELNKTTSLIGYSKIQLSNT